MSSWEELAADLQLEEGLLEAQQPMTNATKDALAEMGISWLQLREVSDAGIAIMHRGKSAGIAAAIARIDTMSMPAYLSHTRGALKKAVQCVRDAGRARLVKEGRIVHLMALRTFELSEPEKLAFMPYFRPLTRPCIGGPLVDSCLLPQSYLTTPQLFPAQMRVF